jgi:hypothetical protein
MESDRVVELQLGVVPEAAVSGAVLFQTEASAHLVFNASAGNARVLVTFERCILTRFGHPNDEARWGIPRFRGTTYGIYRVEHSSWIAEVVRLNRHRFPTTGDDYVKLHYLFAFHDSTFECLADGMKLEVTSRTLAEIARDLVTTD